MQVFISEYLVGGALIGRDCSESMRREGLAMLQAVIADVSRLPGWTVVTTLDESVDWQPACDVIRVESAAQEKACFAKLIDRADAVLMIAPETAGILAGRCRQVPAAASWNCSVAAIELCGDKLALCEHLLAHGLPTIPTAPLIAETLPRDSKLPIVVKPRDGAGSTLTFLVRNRDDCDHVSRSVCDEATSTRFLVQPYVPGRALSIAVNISLDGGQIHSLPVAEQHLTDYRFQYLGGTIPASISERESQIVTDLVLRTCQTIPGLRGYVGFDLILKPDGSPVIVEINPRLTTSYVGYRRLITEPLPGHWLGIRGGPLAEVEDSVTFRV